MVKPTGIDRPLLIVTVSLIIIGFLMIYSSTLIVAKEKYGDSFFFFKRQLIWLLLGAIALAVVAHGRTPFYLDQRVVIPALVVTVLALLAVFFSGKINNTYRWIRLFGFSLQPSELAKVVSVLYLAFTLSRKAQDINQWRTLAQILLPIGVIEALILKEPDFGNFLLILIVTVAMLFVVGLQLRYFAAFSVLLVPALYLLVRSDPLRMQRILGFLNPEAHAATYNFQALQSVYAVGSGGLFGHGIGNSTQKLFFLPYAYTDFIFSIIGEELGLIGTLLVVLLFVAYFSRGLRIARHSGHIHTQLLGTGLTFLIVCQALINISVTIGLFPTKGIPLPFISSGGTSLLASLVVTGILLNISRLRKEELNHD
jgi:cell division protein FtsW